jgi:trans-2,3-dihydro-3-hydroxyanthranilate isomerase
MRRRYYTCDVFTDSLFGGNPLAVLPEAEGLSDTQMQRIAREFNFSETAFVFDAESGGTRKVRIFTPKVEVPFAGHPNIGTAFVLAETGEFGPIEGQLGVTFEEQAGLVPISIDERDGRIWCELAAPEKLLLGRHVPVLLIASAVSLTPDDIVQVTHPPQEASVGLPFVFAELTNADALARARVDFNGFDALQAEGIRPHVHLYVRSNDAFDLRARMFAPHDGVPEDPATGSANCALAGLLSHYDSSATASFSWRIAQGVEMGRPSVLEARADKNGGVVVDTWIGGSSVMVSEGFVKVA